MKDPIVQLGVHRLDLPEPQAIEDYFIERNRLLRGLCLARPKASPRRVEYIGSAGVEVNTCVLDEVIARRGLPQGICCDNGPELTCRHVLAWGLEWKIEQRHTQPGRPMQNGHVESLDERLREECIRANWFSNLFDARSKITDWRKDYSEARPHSSLDYRTT